MHFSNIDQTLRFQFSLANRWLFPTMHLLHGIPPQVYAAFFRHSAGRPLEKAGGAVVCAEDPFWEDSDVARLAELAVRALAKYAPIQWNAFSLC